MIRKNRFMVYVFNNYESNNSRAKRNSTLNEVNLEEILDFTLLSHNKHERITAAVMNQINYFMIFAMFGRPQTSLILRSLIAKINP